MNKLSTSLLDNFHHITPFSIGFDKIFDELSRNVRDSSGYPPYNILQPEDDSYKIIVALAGFGKEDIEVSVKENTLTIKSDTDLDEDDPEIFRGIAFRKFVKEFQLADDVEVKDAKLEKGLLEIDIVRVVPEHKKYRMIEVSAK